MSDNLPTTVGELTRKRIGRIPGAAHSGVVQPITRRSVRELVSSLSRFAIVGTTTTGLYAGLYLLAEELMPLLAANLVAMTLSTIVSTEWHRSWTFQSDRRGIRTQFEAGLVTTVTYFMTSGALLGLERWSPDAGELAQVAAIVGATTVAGLVRYVLLRVWVFARRVPDATAAATPAPRPATTCLTFRAGARHAVRNPRRRRSPATVDQTAQRETERTRS
jgi:putative flippase GtrA